MSMEADFDDQESATIKYYDQNAKSFYQSTAFLDMRDLYNRFERYLPTNAEILDAGCGPGRDILHFLNRGFVVTGFDASSQMVKMARESTGVNIQQMTFNQINFSNQFDGIWACASLLHVSRNRIGEVLGKLISALRTNGVLYASFKQGKHQEIRHGRLFNDYTEEGLRELISGLPAMELLELWITKDLRPERDEIWLNSIMRKNS